MHRPPRLVQIRRPNLGAVGSGAGAVVCKFTQRIEGVRENLTIKSAAMLADALGVPLVVLFKKPRTKKPGPGRPRKRTPGTKTPAG